MAQSAAEKAEGKRQWAENNREKCRESRRQWALRNPEKELASKRKWVRNNLEKSREISRRYRRNNPDARWANHLKHQYDLTPERYWELFSNQGGVCKISGLPPKPGTKLDVDHDHLTKKVRGLLRREINQALGMFGDDTNLLRKAIKYLEQQ